MLYVPKKLSRQEREDYQRWLENHQRSIHEPTRLEQAQRAKSFWQRQAKLIETISTVRGTTRDIPSGPTIEPAQVFTPQMQMNEDELRAREAAARRLIEEKSLQVAPVYNKGGLFYWTEEMAKEFAGGGHRRR